MPAPRTGFIDSLAQARLSWLSGTAYPAVPVGVFLGLYGGAVPGSDGTGGNEITSAARPAIAFGAVVSDGQGRWQRSNSGLVTFTVPAGAAPGEVVGYGIYGATTGGSPNYVDNLPSPFPYAPGQVLSIPIGAVVLISERLP